MCHFHSKKEQSLKHIELSRDATTNPKMIEFKRGQKKKRKEKKAQFKNKSYMDVTNLFSKGIRALMSFDHFQSLFFFSQNQHEHIHI